MNVFTNGDYLLSFIEPFKNYAKTPNLHATLDDEGVKSREKEL